MEIAFRKDQEIGLLLFQKINEPEICKDIILMKNKMEEEEAYNYHYEIWERIASKYFKAIDSNNRHISYVSDGEKYISYKDTSLDFYNETGISHQVRDIIIELINAPDKSWREYDDFMYGILANEIMAKIREC